MFYAKSKPKESIKEHTDSLLENLKILKEVYGNEITKNKYEERIWELLKIICTYHDLGKVYTPFQNKILEKIGQKTIPTKFEYNIKHEQLSPLFVPVRELELRKDEKKLVYQSIFYHHERKSDDIDCDLVMDIINQDIEPNIDRIKEELCVDLDLNPYYLKYVGNGKRIKQGDKLYNEYCLLKGLLHRLDHCSSGNMEIEDDTNEKILDYTENYMKNKNYSLNDLQQFTKDNSSKNIVVIGSTGMGKTEAALLWSNNSKSFFTLPIRISINAIYDRIKENIGYRHVGLLHSTALQYLEEKQEFENEFEVYEQTRNLCSKVTTCTIDQIFPIVFKYKGYEKVFATLEYSKVIIDEVQAYSPEIVAVILKGLQMINNIGGKFMIMTATLPRIYKEELENMGMQFEYNEFLKNSKRHKLKIEDLEIIEDINNIYENSKEKKVLVIVNTVNKAIELYQRLSDFDDINVNLLHSRFVIRDRNKKEVDIKEFSEKNSRGIWITTQLVEASLDIDFDCLYTEMSTLDSLFQRLGRCYRSREYEGIKPNVHIYINNVTGVGEKNVYDKDIHNMSVELIRDFDNRFIMEKDKIKLVDKLYSKEMLENTRFLKNFESGMEILNNIIDYNTDKSAAQSLLRNIENVTVIPKKIYDENIDLFERYSKSNNYYEKMELKREINKLTTSISEFQAKRKFYEYISEISYLENKKEILCIDLKYDENVGLILKYDKEYELDERFC